MTIGQAGWVGGNEAKRAAMAPRAPARHKETREDGDEAKMRMAREELSRHEGLEQEDVTEISSGAAPASRTSRAPSGSRARLASARAARFQMLSGPGELNSVTILLTPPHFRVSSLPPFWTQTFPTTLSANSRVRPL